MLPSHLLALPTLGSVSSQEAPYIPQREYSLPLNICRQSRSRLLPL